MPPTEPSPPISAREPTRDETLDRLAGEFDVLVVGGGATGLGIALDAVTRGLRTALVEAGDFAQATSSRATKLVHGGVRYLASAQFHLVYEALHERRVLLRNAPHLVQAQPFVTPAYAWPTLPYYWFGLKLYDLLSGASSLGRTRMLSARGVRQRIPGIASAGLRGGILYFDGQFDDARLALALARTAIDRGAVVANYVRCVALRKSAGRIVGAALEDVETGRTIELRAAAVVNATGIFADSLRRLDEPASSDLLTVSRGTHVVLDSTLLGGDTAIMVPKTPDGRVVFAIPWQGRVLVGTTDVAAPTAAVEPGHDPSEIDFLLSTVQPYLARSVGRQDILSIFSGLRPLVSGPAAQTSKLSREHSISISLAGLITIAGGKWTTYRRMAQDTLDAAARHGLLPARPCITAGLPLRGAAAAPPSGPLHRYGADAPAIEALWRSHPALREPLDSALPFTRAEVVYAARAELARTVEDVLSRRTRALLLDARSAQRAAPVVASLLAAELGRSSAWAESQSREFTELAQRFYLPAR